MNFFGKKIKRSDKGHSEHYQTFLHDYFTGPNMIRGRREEDVTVWDKLKGEELELAKQKIMDNLDSCDESYIRAAGIFKDERAIPILKQIAENGSNIHIQLYAAKTLYNWVGFEGFEVKLDKAFTKASQFTKTDLACWSQGLEEETALKLFWKAMNDPDSFVRFCSYEALEQYYGIWEFRKDGFEIKYFTDQEVYENKELFNERQAELREKIKTWKKR